MQGFVSRCRRMREPIAITQFGKRDRASGSEEAVVQRMDSSRVWNRTTAGETYAKICILGRVFEDALTQPKFFDIILSGWRGTQVVRERSAKPLCVGSIPTRASKFLIDSTLAFNF